MGIKALVCVWVEISLQTQNTGMEGHLKLSYIPRTLYSREMDVSALLRMVESHPSMVINIKGAR